MTDPMATFDGQWQVQPPLSDEQLAEVPAKRGVLLLQDERGKPIILLTAADLRARLRGRLSEPEGDHRSRRADLRAVTRKILWKLAWSHFEADLQYLRTARSLWPKRYTEMISWRPAWFVHVDVADPHPHFRRTRDVFARPGEYFGPMPDGRSADRFVAAIQDGLDLCRHYNCLRQSPNAQPCAYAQMGRCLCPCDGSIPMDAYRDVVARAAAFARGRRDEARQRLTGEMRSASAQRQFERAAGRKARLDRLAEVDAPLFEHTRPAEAFRFVLVQSGPDRRTARAFLADRGAIAPGADLSYPLKKPELRKLLARMGRLCRREAPAQDEAAPSRVGLVTRYLLSSEKRRGLVLHWSSSTTAEHLAEAIEHVRDLLRLRAPRASKPAAPGKEASKPQATGG